MKALKVRKQIHVSAVNMMSECQVRAEFRYLRGIRRPPSAYLLVGSSTDESVAKNLGNKITTGELLPRKDAVEIAAVKLDAMQEKDPIELDTDEKAEGKSIESVLGEAKDKTVALAGLHWDQPAQVIAPKFVQHKFSIDMDAFLRRRAKRLHQEANEVPDRFFQKQLHNRASALNAAARDGVDFAGEIDILEEDPANLVIRDTKTSGKSPNKGSAEDSMQLTAYSLATQAIPELGGRLPDAAVLDYLVYTPKRHELKYVPLTNTPEQEDNNVFLNRFAVAVQAFRTGVFVPAPATYWGCSEKFCGYFGICEYVKHPKTTSGLVTIEKAEAAV